MYVFSYLLRFNMYDHYFNVLYYILILREEHRKLHELHKGHESMHAEMLIILMITMIVAQIVLLEWKRRHFRSFQVNYIFNI